MSSDLHVHATVSGSDVVAVRTPDAAFANVPDFPWRPSYVDDLPGYEGLRMAYVDAGPAEAAEVFVCLHGEPSWSFLYRKMIPVFLESGARVVAPDFFGFGRSDKPIDDDLYTHGFHRGALLAFLDRLELPPFTLVCQDWGGLLGLTIPVDRPEAIARLLVMNTTIPTGREPVGAGFEAWKAFVAGTEDLDVGRLMGRAAPLLSESERAAYSAPFPNVQSKAGVRRFPAIVPVTADMEGADLGVEARKFWSERWSGPTFMAVGAQDPVLGPPAMKGLRRIITGCPEPMMIEDAGHFVQESGEAIARAALEAWSRDVP